MISNPNLDCAAVPQKVMGEEERRGMLQSTEPRRLD
jgi:hypothetical protein